MSIRLLFVFGACAWGACVSGRLVDSGGASIDDAKVALEFRSAVVVEGTAAKDGHFRVCADVSGDHRIVAKQPGFRSPSTAAFALRQAVELGAIEMSINRDDWMGGGRITTGSEPDPYFDPGGDFVSFTGRDGVRRKFARQPNDRQHNLDGDWKRAVFFRGNEIWIDNRRVNADSAYIWEPEFTPDGKSIRFWSTTWKDGDRQFTVPINETGSRR